MGTPNKVERWMLELIREQFPMTLTREIADTCGVAKSTIEYWAKRMGIEKDPAYMIRTRRMFGKMVGLLNKGNPDRYFKKGHKPTNGFKKGHIPYNRKEVIRLDTLKVYESMSAAAKDIGKTDGALSNCIKRRCKCGGTRWMYYEQYQRIQERKKQEPQWKRNRI